MNAKPRVKRQRRGFIPAWDNVPGVGTQTQAGLKARAISQPIFLAAFGLGVANPDEPGLWPRIVECLLETTSRPLRAVGHPVFRISDSVIRS